MPQYSAFVIPPGVPGGGSRGTGTKIGVEHENLPVEIRLGSASVERQSLPVNTASNRGLNATDRIQSPNGVRSWEGQPRSLSCHLILPCCCFAEPGLMPPELSGALPVSCRLAIAPPRPFHVSLLRGIVFLVCRVSSRPFKHALRLRNGSSDIVLRLIAPQFKPIGGVARTNLSR